MFNEDWFSMHNGPDAEVRQRIAERGQITFAEFMEVALYHPSGGYYTRTSQRTDRGDYYTSPSAHPAFSALLAVHLEAMWEILGRPNPFDVVEIGAGTGLMARDVSEYAQQNLGRFGESMCYHSVDRYPQRAQLSDVVAETPSSVVGCVLSNELVDAFPVHRFEMKDRQLAEVFVTTDDDSHLVSIVDAPSTPLLTQRLDDLDVSLPDGMRGEICLEIGPWMRQLSDMMSKGFVLTIDYGYEAPELYSSRRSKGTLQTYFKHTTGSSPYQWVGDQDITAHVDFTSVVNEGSTAGLNPLGLITQVDYLERLGIRRWMESMQTLDIPRRERDANAMALHELVKPEGLGGFKVLFQEKGTGVTGAKRTFPVPGRIDELPFPALSPEHVPLLEDRYPNTTWEVENLWPFED